MPRNIDLRKYMAPVFIRLAHRFFYPFVTILTGLALYGCGTSGSGDQGRNVAIAEGDDGPTSSATLLDIGGAPSRSSSPAGGAMTPFPATLPVARFNLAEDPAKTPLAEIPYPSDIYRYGDGRLNFSFFPQRTSGNLIDTIIESLEAETPGFGTTSSLYIGFDGPIDPRVLPENGLASRTEESGLFVVNIDPTSPEYNERMPIDWKILDGPSLYLPQHTLGIRLVEGLRLLPQTTYALIATSAIARPAPGFATMLQTDAPTGALVTPWTAFAPLRAWLETQTVDVSTASVFKTQDPTSDLFKVRDFLHTMPAPVPTEFAYLGVKNDAFEIFEGVYSAPRFQEGAIPFRTQGTGAIRFDGDTPIVQGMETLRFALSIPTNHEMPPEGWPVVLYGHGTGGYYKTFTTNSAKVALVLARAGVAVLSIDQIHHGRRDTSSNPCYEQPSPDSCVSLLFFNFVVPNAGRDNVRQSALDFVSLMRMAQNFDETLTRTTQRVVNRFADGVGGAPGTEFQQANGGGQALEAFGGQMEPGPLADEPANGGAMAVANAGGATAGSQEGTNDAGMVRVKLDPNRIIYMGHSQGGLNGPLFLAVEKDILAGVISAGGASFPISIEQKTKPLDINAVVSGLIPLDQGEVVDRWHPTLALVQTFIEPGEPANYAAYWFESPREGYAPKHILMTAGLSDEYTPPETIFALAAAGRVPIISPVLEPIALFDAFGIEPAGTPPYSGNVADGRASAGLIQVNGRGHFVIQRDLSVQQRYRQFIRSVFDGNPQIF
ncbi:MAG: hypothetical protein VX589_20480 [Myxococcota bacterium]|nr:hypothetical protein [Myxococcota bacterium]